MQQNEDTIKQQQNEIEDLKRKLRLKDEAEAKVRPPLTQRIMRGSNAQRRTLATVNSTCQRFAVVCVFLFQNGDLMRRLERESAERMRRLEKEFADKERFLDDKYSAESKGHRGRFTR